MIETARRLIGCSTHFEEYIYHGGRVPGYGARLLLCITASGDVALVGLSRADIKSSADFECVWQLKQAPLYTRHPALRKAGGASGVSVFIFQNSSQTRHLLSTFE